MTYTVEIKDGRKVIKGDYVPKEYSCKCKECSFTIEVLKCATDEQIKAIVDFIQGV